MTRILSLFVMFMLCGVVAFSQNRVVTGTVRDDRGEVVEAASVRVVGTNAGAATDAAGNFRLTNVAPNASLQVSGVGFVPTTVNTGTQGVVNVRLPRATTTPGTELQTVTVGAFGLRTSKTSQGYSSSTVSKEQLLNGRPVNVAQALSGKVPGLSIGNTSSSVNAAPRILLRGLRSITGDNQALIVVDGVQVPRNFINQINPNDIERIEVLPGGQSTTLFGSEGINGAIVITTKKGTNRAPEVTFQNTFNVETVAYLPRTQHGFGSGSAYGSDPSENFNPAENQQYGDAYNGSIRPAGRVAQNGSILLLPYSDIQNVRRRVWDVGYTRQSDLSFRAGDATSSLFMSFQNLNTNGLVPGDKYDRNVLRFNAGKTYNKFGLSFDGSYAFDRSRRTNTDYYFFAMNTPSWIPSDRFKDWQNDYLSNPNQYYNDYYNNPYWELDNSRFNTRSYTFNGNIKLDYKATSNLTLTGRVNLTQANSTTTIFASPFTYSAWSRGRNPGAGTGAFFNNFNVNYDRLFGTGIFRARSTPIQGSNAEQQSTSSRITFDAFADYNKDFGKISLRAVIGSQAIIERGKSLSVSTTTQALPGLFNLGNNSATGSGTFLGGNAESQTRKIGGFATATVGFDDLVFVTGSIRNDYTSRFADYLLPNYRNPSFSTYGGDASFVVSNLIPGITRESRFVNLIKFRGGYNVNGNDNLGAYQLRTTYGFATQFPFAGLIGTSVSGLAPDDNLVPEKVKTAELGAEFGLFKQRLTISGQVYRADCDQQVLTVSTDPAAGIQSYLLNVGRMINKGYEVEVKAQAYRSENLNVGLTANYSYNENEIVDLYGQEGITNFLTQAPDDRASINASQGKMYPYLKATAFQRDASGKVIVDRTDGWPERTDTRVDMGSTLPKHNLGVGFSVNFKNFTFVANAEYRGGAVVYHDLGTDLAFTGAGAQTAIYNRQQFIWPNSVYLDASGKSIPNTDVAVDQYKAMYQGFGDLGFSRGLSGVGEMFVTSADFWKIRDISLTFDFPKEVFGSGKIFKGASFTAFARNLITILPKENWFTDPEFANTNGNSIGVNTTLNTPPARQIGGTIRFVF